MIWLFDMVDHYDPDALRIGRWQHIAWGSGYTLLGGGLYCLAKYYPSQAGGWTLDMMVPVLDTLQAQRTRHPDEGTARRHANRTLVEHLDKYGMMLDRD